MQFSCNVLTNKILILYFFVCLGCTSGSCGFPLCSLCKSQICWLVGWFLLGFNATLTAKVISWRSVTHACFMAFSPVLTQRSFQSQQLLFSHASAEVKGENTPEKNVALTGNRTHNHQVLSQTGSPLSHLGGV